MIHKIFKSRFSEFFDESFSIIRNKIIFDKNITASELRVFMAVWSNKEGYPLKQKQLAEKIGITPASFNRLLKSLEEHGYVFRLVYSDTEKGNIGSKKYNYFFCDMGRAKYYYLALLNLGVINQRGTILRNLEKVSSTDLMNITYSSKSESSIELINERTRNYIEGLEISAEARHEIYEKVKSINDDLFNTLEGHNKDELISQGYNLNEIKFQKTYAQFFLSWLMVKDRIDILKERL